MQRRRQFAAAFIAVLSQLLRYFCGNIANPAFRHVEGNDSNWILFCPSNKSWITAPRTASLAFVSRQAQPIGPKSSRTKYHPALCRVLSTERYAFRNPSAVDAPYPLPRYSDCHFRSDHPQAVGCLSCSRPYLRFRKSSSDTLSVNFVCLLRVKQAWPSIFPFPNLILYD